MKEIKAIIQPVRLSRVIEALKAMADLPGVTGSEVRGFGKSRAADATQKVVQDEVEYSKKVKLEIVVPESRVEDVVQAIFANAHAGRTVVVIGTSDHVCGFVGLADAIRPEARKSVLEMRNAGIRHIVMLTGDNRGTAEQIAAQTGVDETRAELLPADKVAAVDELVQRYGAVAMVGDGVNDAPAMGRATLGIAMGAAGSDAAIEAADVALMSDDLSKLPWLIRHSTKTLRIVRQNIALSLAVKGIFVVLTFAGSASLWAAIAADMGVSLLVISNALRLIRPHV
jgi:Cd2+/Zn2+-exporting ATPase